MRIALATSADLPDLIEDEAPLRRALALLGADARPAVWSDPSVDWAAFDAVLIRTTWDYTTRLAEFLAWADRAGRASRLINPAPIVRWNTHKRYLAELASAGVNSLPINIVPRGARLDLLASMEAAGMREAVIKPAVGATSRRQARVASDPRGGFLTIAEGQAHLDAALAEEDMILQPYARSIETEGERSLVYVGGVFRHALRKRPRAGDYRVQADWGGRYEPCDPDPAELALGDAAHQALRTSSISGHPIIYSRVDVVTADNRPALIELELVEPQLFFRQGAGTGETLAEHAVRAAADGR